MAFPLLLLGLCDFGTVSFTDRPCFLHSSVADVSAGHMTCGDSILAQSCITLPMTSCVANRLDLAVVHEYVVRKLAVTHLF